jgi:hypothetical protein
VPSYDSTVQSGVYLADGTPKPALQAFRFPLVGERADGRTLRVWGRSPVAGTVRIERRAGAAWKLVRTVRAKRHGTFLVRIKARRKTSVRARIAGQASLAWPAT